MRRDDEAARGEAPCPPHTPTATCAPPHPRHAPFPHWPEIVVAVTDAHTRARPCPPPGRQGGHRRLSPPPVLNSSFLCSFFMFFPFSSFPPSPFLSCPPPHSSLSLSSLHFSKVSQPCPPTWGPPGWGPPSGWGTSYPQSEEPLSLGTLPSRMGIPCLDGDPHRLRTSLPGWGQPPKVGDPPEFGKLPLGGGHPPGWGWSHKVGEAPPWVGTLSSPRMGIFLSLGTPPGGDTPPSMENPPKMGIA